MKVAIIQARCSSTRLPNKIFADLSGKPLIWHVIDRLTFCRKIDKIVLATTTHRSDDKLVEWASREHIACFRGSEDNVLNRYYAAAKSLSLKQEDILIRITADDPFKEPTLIDRTIEPVENGKTQFAYNNNPPSFPEGLDCEVFTMAALKLSEIYSKDPYEREHVTQYMYRHPEIFKGLNISNEHDLSYLRLTMDTEEDYEMAKIIYAHLYKENQLFTLTDILSLLQKHPEIAQINASVKRSDMYKK
ncbi:MAG: glycosyltransferase family protein [Dysgonamonadaceae bacterium]|jgi:spore coat polysaccharide biosynthesis protein SpsF|nr:glycosyltransferase family protein [Dysgonamonadaceae bacterium]